MWKRTVFCRMERNDEYAEILKFKKPCQSSERNGLIDYLDIGVSRVDFHI